MALGFVERFTNFSDKPLTVRWNEKNPLAWAPSITSIGGNPPSLHTVRLSALTGSTSFSVPAAATTPSTNTQSPGLVIADQLAVPWSNSGDMTLSGSAGHVDLFIGPKAANGNDFLQCRDPHGNEMFAIDMGGQGGGWKSTVWTFRVYIESDGAVRMQAWSITGPGSDLIGPLGEAAKNILNSAGGALGSLLFT